MAQSLDPLTALLVGIGRKEGYIPPQPITNINASQIFGERGEAVVSAATNYLFKNMSASGKELLPKTFVCVFCTAVNDAYAWHTSLGSDSAWVPKPFDGSESTLPEQGMEDVLPAVAMFMRKSPLPVQFHNLGMNWVLEHQTEFEADGVLLPQAVLHALFLTYNAGLMRALKALRYWGDLSEVLGPVIP